MVVFLLSIEVSICSFFLYPYQIFCLVGCVIPSCLVCVSSYYIPDILSRGSYIFFLFGLLVLLQLLELEVGARSTQRLYIISFCYVFLKNFSTLAHKTLQWSDNIMLQQDSQFRWKGLHACIQSFKSITLKIGHPDIKVCMHVFVFET